MNVKNDENREIQDEAIYIAVLHHNSCMPSIWTSVSKPSET